MAVEKYAFHYKYSLIMRFNREEAEGSDEPQAVLNSMNRQVVYHREDDDVTEPVLQFLNRSFEKVNGSADATPEPAKSAVRTAGGAK